MAIVNATQSTRALDMANLPLITGWITGTATQVRVTTGSEQQNYFGTFQFSQTGVVTGSVDSVYYRNSYNESQYSVTGLHFDALTVMSHIAANQLPQLTWYLFAGDDVIYGTSKDDRLLGLGGNDRIYAGLGNDTVDGGPGIDTVHIPGLKVNATIIPTASGQIVTSATGGTDTLSNVERIVFDDKAVAHDIEGVAGWAYRLYQAAFDRKPDLGGLGGWINYMDNGHSLYEVSSMFQRSDEFVSRYGAKPSTESFVTLLYQNVLHRAPDPGGFADWVNALNTNQISREQTLIGFSESPENKAALIGVIQNGIEYVPMG